MAYSGYLIKFGTSASGTTFPLKYIKAESYSCTPDQRLELNANRAVTGKLVRQTASHTASKIEFETVYLTNKERAAIQTLLSNAYTSAAERKLNLYYYDDATDSYKTGEFYVPDVQYKIYRVDNVKNIIYYSPVRYAFIEY